MAFRPGDQRGRAQLTTSLPGRTAIGRWLEPLAGGAGLDRIVLPLLTAGLALLLWELACRGLDISPGLLPPPSAVYERFLETQGFLYRNAVPTTVESVLAFVLATVLGTLLAVLLTYSELAYKALYPNVVFFQLIPKIALAPLFVVWLGIGAESRLSFAVFISFFPIVVSAMAGFRAVPPDMMRLCRSLTATEWQIFMSVRFPFALPHLFAGMKIAVTFAMIGVIIGEFITADQGLGYIIIFSSSQADTALILASIALLCVIGLALFGLVAASERLMYRWYGVH
jgi:NitT/TauT family transport system permease protein